MKVVIFEDDKEFACCLIEFVSESVTDIEIVFVTDSIRKMMDYVAKEVFYSVYLLDIDIYGISQGLTVAQNRLNLNRDMKFVFITNYPDRILFESGVYNIILKDSPRLLNERKVIIESLLIKQIIVYNDKFPHIFIMIEKIFYVESMKGKK